MKVLMIIGILTIAIGAAGQTAGLVEDPGIQLLRVQLQRVDGKVPQTRAVPSTDPSSQAKQRADQLRDVDNAPALHRLSRDAEIAPLSGSAPLGTLPSAPSVVFVASVLIKNTGRRTITAVHWEYLFFMQGAEQPVKRVRVQSKKVILPGEQIELTKEVRPKGKEHQAVITRV